ncbi:hypothetical protein EVAR_68638_1 [Eumeta japonica]|uniref:Uncharacterized protein n=1 Tax=Eumeta variegata TaxID=151549 RepID=A0A4C1ZQV4_EUMVA|nr:hypothetical protein EVAR_68638_1 [Eumeta japonica]
MVTAAHEHTRPQMCHKSAAGLLGGTRISSKGDQIRYHTLTEYRREDTATAVTSRYRPVSESSGGQLAFHHPTPAQGAGIEKTSIIEKTSEIRL